jgi:hypothetical protein
MAEEKGRLLCFSIFSVYSFATPLPGHKDRRGIRGDSPGANGTDFLKV